MHLGALPNGRANAPEISNTLLPRYRDSPRDRMHPANHTSADGVHSGWIARVTRFCKPPNPNPTRKNYPQTTQITQIGE